MIKLYYIVNVTVHVLYYALFVSMVAMKACRTKKCPWQNVNVTSYCGSINASFQTLIIT